MKRSKDVFVGSTHKSKQGCSFTVLEYKNFEDVLVEFNDSHKHRASFKSQHIKNGDVKNPYHKSVYSNGYIGFGDFKPKSEPIAYGKWKRMLERCYCPKRHAKAKSYVDCTVCDEWMNFQNFAEWFLSHPKHQREFDLDKDLLGSEKIYSPSTCILLPNSINTALARTYKSNEYKSQVIAKLASQLAMFIDVKAYNALMSFRS